ncbi:MAG: RluA family pseudouridine synthase [Candidatus Paceibacterota bacterium]|jgi:23S rRNA pseudouridine1911/1915/1917 synthase
MSNRDKVKINILYEDQDILAVNKPSGMMVHGDGKKEGLFLSDWILENYPDTKDVGEPARSQKGESISRPGIVHRLDTETSGVILIAKTPKGFDCLKRQFQERTIKKTYLALVWGEMKEPFGTINKSIGRSGSDFRKWSSQRGARGEMREAETYWEKIKNIKCKVLVHGKEKLEKATLVRIEPKTGRTHQIRVHFTSIQHPVVGDKLYAPKKPMPVDLSIMALHAKSIEFIDCNNKKIKVESDIPLDMKKIV